MTIMIDMDGVIRDIITPMCSLYNQEMTKCVNSFPQLRPEDVKAYDVGETFGLIKEYFGIEPKDFFFKKYSKELFLDSKPFNGVSEAIEKLHNMGNKIVIVTWQMSYESKMYTLKFLEKNHIYYDDICFTRDKEMINGDVLIDDNPEFLEKQPDGVLRVCVRRPYNEWYHGCHMKVDSLDYFVNTLRDLFKMEVNHKIAINC